MGIRERRQRQKAATREGILTAALILAKNEGWQAVTVRRLAELVEYTPPIIYRYFASKDALFKELQNRGFDELNSRIAVVYAAAADPRERLIAMADTYIVFAYERPELYELMHGSSSAAVDLDSTLEQATSGASIIENCLEEWAASRSVSLRSIEDCVDIAWGLLHGLITVEMLGRISGGKDRVRTLAENTIKDLLKAWATG